MTTLVAQFKAQRDETQIELQQACSNLRRQVEAVPPIVKKIKRDVKIAKETMIQLRKIQVKYLKASNQATTITASQNFMEVNNILLSGVLELAADKLEELGEVSPKMPGDIGPKILRYTSSQAGKAA